MENYYSNVKKNLKKKQLTNKIGAFIGSKEKLINLTKF